MPPLDNIRHESFCNAYVNNKETRGNGSASMRVAGYGEGYCRGGATVLLKREDVSGRINELQEKRDSDIEDFKQRKKYNIKELFGDIEDAKEIARDQKDWRGILACVDRQTKLLGYDSNPSKARGELGMTTVSSNDNIETEEVDESEPNILKREKIAAQI